MVPKCKLFENIPHHVLEDVYELEYVGEKALSLNLPLEFAKKNSPTSFLNYLLEST